MSAAHKGGCRCGALRFTAMGEPLRVMNCHCADCRKATGAAFVTFVDYSRAKVTFTGELAHYAPSPGVERFFCAKCGSPIAYQGDASPDECNIHIGAFDEPSAFRPSGDCHEHSALWRDQ